MQDKVLFKVSLIISVMGTFLVLLILEYSEVKLTEINSLGKNQLETRVKVQGAIVSIKETPGLYILTIKDTSATIPLVIFKEDTLALEKNTQVEVIGKLTEYKKELEIIVEKIKI
ncbi:OB-fold nucleic acid binding domain-containing protein [Candidatus Woesearchaeota archaeon]|nr:OB-fold nucleic acid binding domain-containing protein [Candidatus Woesearchaeota archaeon]